MKNYYEILEVDKNASQEVIEKAYKTLAKKYHPDLQQGAIQQEYAEKMKIINQAYDVLSDSAKREEYNQNLENERIQKEKMQNEIFSIEEQQRIMRENYELKQQINRMHTNNNVVDEGSIGNMGRILSQQINEARSATSCTSYCTSFSWHNDRGSSPPKGRRMGWYRAILSQPVVKMLPFP